jgi:hypothetical protein
VHFFQEGVALPGPELGIFIKGPEILYLHLPVFGDCQFFNFNNQFRGFVMIGNYGAVNAFISFLEYRYTFFPGPLSEPAA